MRLCKLNLANRPQLTSFRQQNLKAWQPIYTAGSVSPAFFFIGMIFVQVGVAIYLISHAVEYTLDYTACQSKETDGTCAEVLANNISSPCTCNISFKLDSDMPGKVYMYYALENLYQNHRLYVRSRNDDQLLGRKKTCIESNCYPFEYTKDDVEIAPSGAIANSLFNDTLTLSHQGKEISMFKIGIAWESDRDRKFKNPPGDLKSALGHYAKPLYWTKHVYELDKENPDNNGFQNEDLRVWMHNAAFSKFKKLYRIIDQNGLEAGEYVLNVAYQYPVDSFDGLKKMVLSNTNFYGAPNQFLYISYLVVGGIFLVLGAVLLVLHIRWRQVNEELVGINSTTGLSKAAAESKFSLRRI